MRIVLSTAAVLALAGGGRAGDEKEPHAAHTGGPFLCREHTKERAGVTGTARFTTPSINCSRETGGWIGGNRVAHSTPGTACVPNPGVFGWDYVGLGKFPGRIFLGFGPDKKHQQPFQTKYNTDKPTK